MSSTGNVTPGYSVPAGLLDKEVDGIEVPKTVEQVERELVLEQFQEIHQALKKARMPRERVWDQCWALYNSQFDWSGKAEWQSKIGLPHVRETVDKAAASFRKALLRAKRFYQIESETKLGVQKGMFTTSLIDYWLDQNDTDFINQFTDALKTGLITSTMILKVWWNWHTCYDPRIKEGFKQEDILDPLTGEIVGTRQVPTTKIDNSPYAEGRLGIAAIDPYNFWCDPTKNIYIERTVVDMSYVWHLYEQGVYKNKEAIEQLNMAAETELNRHKEALRKGESPKTSPAKFVRDVELYHYWGNLYSEDGKILQENVTYTLGNVITGDYTGSNPTVMLRPPTKNGFIHKKAPYIVGSPYRVPFSTYHRGIVEDIIGIVTMIVELANSVVDGAQFEAAGGHEIDMDLCENPQQFEKGVHPGLAITTKGLDNPSGKPVVRPIEVGKVPQGALAVIQWLSKERELSTAITSGMLGVPVNTRTSSEFNASLANANEGLDDAARTVEEMIVNPMLELISKTIYQYHNDYLMPRLIENFPQTAMMLADMSPVERYATMMNGFQFKARGMSIYLDKMQDRQRVIEFLQGLGSIPGALERINIDALLEEWFMTFGWNPEKMLISPSTQPVSTPPGPMEMMQPRGQSGFPTAEDTRRLTPAQISAGMQGAQKGGARNNPMAVGR